MDGHAKKIKPWEACTATVAVCIHNMLESSYYVYCTSSTCHKNGVTPRS